MTNLYAELLGKTEGAVNVAVINLKQVLEMEEVNPEAAALVKDTIKMLEKVRKENNKQVNDSVGGAF